MSQPEQPDRESVGATPGGAFPLTRWSLILNAQDEDPEALAGFCRAYWFPLYSYARRMNLSAADAEDLTQSFFERLLSRDLLRHARQERGRLRNFLLRSFANFTAEEWRKRGAQKRGSEQTVLEFDALSAEGRFALEPHDSVTPEVEYERAWARELLRQTLEKLATVYEAAGNGTIFRALRDHLTEGSVSQSYQEIAAKLGQSEGATRFAAFKLRQRYRATLREIVAETVASDEEVENELVYLRALFQS